MKAHVVLPDFDPRNWHWLLVLRMQPTFKAVTSRAILAHYELARMPLEDRSQRCKYFCKGFSHVGTARLKFGALLRGRIYQSPGMCPQGYRKITSGRCT